MLNEMTCLRTQCACLGFFWQEHQMKLVLIVIDFSEGSLDLLLLKDSKLLLKVFEIYRISFHVSTHIKLSVKWGGGGGGEGGVALFKNVQ